jgi:hypothetical protein
MKNRKEGELGDVELGKLLYNFDRTRQSNISRVVTRGRGLTKDTFPAKELF